MVNEVAKKDHERISDDQAMNRGIKWTPYVLGSWARSVINNRVKS